MRFLLDTNVISEPLQRDPDAEVIAWVRSCNPLDLHLSVISLGEIERGIHELPEGAKRARLATWARTALVRQFAGRVHEITLSVSRRWGALVAESRRRGRSTPLVDGLLLATAAEHDLTLVTRNVSHCEGRGVPVLDPWSGILHES